MLICDIPSVFKLKQNCENFAKYELLWLYDIMATNTNIKLCIQRCDVPERHEMLTIISD